MLAFGPIPSRRLGRSLGINNIPAKVCSYTCTYCQQGRSSRMQLERQVFYDPEELVAEVSARVKQVLETGESIDYLSFVPDGEPTLDINLGREIELLRPLGIKIAVITNCTLLDNIDVRQELAGADWVSLKVDSVEESSWRKVDRPLRSLSLDRILESILTFSREFTGQLVTETMLVQGLNDQKGALEATAHFLTGVRPNPAYISIPTRPPAEAWAKAPQEDTIHLAYQIFSSHLSRVELLLGYEGNAFSSSGDARKDILSISAVHPLRRDAVQGILQQAGQSWDVVEELVRSEQLVPIRFDGQDYFMRKLYPGYRRPF